MKPALHFPVIVAGKSKRRFQISLWPFASRNGLEWIFELKLRNIAINWQFALTILLYSNRFMKSIFTA